MPAFSATGPVIALRPGFVDRLFDAETVGDGEASQACCVPPNCKSLLVEINWAAPPVGANISVQGAMSNVDAEYREITSSTSASGEALPIPNCVWQFIRILKNGGDQALTVKVTPKSER